MSRGSDPARIHKHLAEPLRPKLRTLGETATKRTVCAAAWPDGTCPVVSIVCWSYNHEIYIAQAVDSFLAQETTFPVEIIIHDDASTDGTATIARLYEDRYPRIFRNIIQPENLFQKGFDINQPPYAHARGKYIAICEADDYWTRSDKLQRQVDFLETHPECAGVFHRGYAVNAERNRIPFVWDGLEYKERYDQSDCIFDLLSGYPTAALVFRRSALKFPFPRYFLECPTDFTTDVMLTESGTLGFLDFDGCAYRQHTGGTWSTLKASEMQRCGVRRLISLYRDDALRRRHPKLIAHVIRQVDVAWWNHFIEKGSGWAGWFAALTLVPGLLLPRSLTLWLSWLFRSDCPVLFKARDLIRESLRNFSKKLRI